MFLNSPDRKGQRWGSPKIEIELLFKAERVDSYHPSRTFSEICVNMTHEQFETSKLNFYLRILMGLCVFTLIIVIICHFQRMFLSFLCWVYSRSPTS